MLAVILLALLVCHSVNGQEVGLYSQSSSDDVPNVGILPASEIGEAGEGLECQSDDNNAEGQWYYPNGDEVNLYQPSVFSNEALYQLRGPGVVVLYRRLSLNDEGIYTCRIPDSTGEERVLYVGLYNNVDAPSIVSLSFTRFTDLTTQPPSFSLTCDSTLFPPTDVEWTMDDVLIDDGDSYALSQTLVSATTTTFRNVLNVNGTRSGTFVCDISNEYGTVNSSYEVTVPSGPPMDINIQFLGSGDINVTWTPPSGTIIGYRLFYQLVELNDTDFDPEIIDIGGDANSVIIEGLEAEVDYTVRMIAFADLPSVISDPVPFILQVAGSPSNIVATPSSPTTLDVTWDPPIDGQEFVFRYIVEFNATGPRCGLSHSGNSTTMFTNITLTGLQEDTTYNITVRTESFAALGDPSAPITGSTLEGAPAGPPLNVIATPMCSREIFVSWSPPECQLRNRPVVMYVLNVDRTNVSTITVTNETTGEQVPFVTYNVTVAAVDEEGRGSISPIVRVPVVGIPPGVDSLRIDNTDITSFTVTWNPPRPELIDRFFTDDFNYTIQWFRPAPTEGGEPEFIDRGVAVRRTSFEIENLLAGIMYRVNVSSVSSCGTGGSVVIAHSTNNITVVSGLRVTENSSSSVIIAWDLLPETSDITFYRVYYNSTNRQSHDIVDSSRPPLHLSNLDGSLTYEFTISAVAVTTLEQEGPLSPILTFTFSEPATSQLLVIVIPSVIGGFIVLSVIIIITIAFLAILIRNIGPELAVKDESMKLVPVKLEGDEDDDIGKPPNSRPIIIGTPPSSIHAVEGQEVVLQVHFHGNPRPKLTWKRDEEDIDWETSDFINRGGALVFPNVAIDHTGQYNVTAENLHGNIGANIDLIVYPDTEQTRPSSSQMLLSSAPIPVGEFGQYVASLHSNHNKTFRDQFRRLPMGDDNKNFEIAFRVENRPLNRFSNVLVYDDNRVELAPISRFLDCEHDYINASYIIGEGEIARKYIATQGPLSRTVVDLWRMVWQERVPAIVMLTKLQEDLKIMCTQYWPSSGSEMYGPFKVTLLSETQYTDYIVREISVHYDSMATNMKSVLVNPTRKINLKKKERFRASQSTLHVTQYHYLGWPDHRGPSSISSLLSLRDRLVQQCPDGKDPIVVHCSNGVGRTAAFIAIDMGVEQARIQGTIDMPSIVVDMRQQRMKMVQSVGQYMTVHDAIVEQIICGHTHSPAIELHQYIKTLTVKNDKNSLTGFEEQFANLEQVCLPADAVACNNARMQQRKNRNRCPLPTDQWRVYLRGEVPDYINATYLPGYNKEKGFIVAQSPLPDTRRDFWKMVFDHDIGVVVMLCQSMENGEEVCSQYWPNKDNVEFGEFLVSVKEEWSHEGSGFTRRVLFIRHKKNNMLRKVVQFQVTDWSSDGSSHFNTMGILNTINLVTTVQRKAPHIPSLVHCSNSIGRSAMFCAVVATIDQCKCEGRTDIFQVVKKMRGYLPGVVETPDQYKVIYGLVAAYINIFSTCANYE